MYDHSTDKNLTVVYQLSKTVQLPDFVKSAKVDDTQIKELPNSAFADPVHRRFPCHTRADTYLSYAYFLKNASELPPTSRQITFSKLNDFINHWAIRTECETVRIDHEKRGCELGQLPDDVFAIVEDVSGTKYRALPLLNDKCVKSASDHLTSYRDRYPLAWRIKAARKIAAQAEKLNVEISEYVTKAAGLHKAASANDIASRLVKRSMLLNDDQLKAATLKLARHIVSGNTVDIPTTMDLVEKLDLAGGLTSVYRHGLSTPEEILAGELTRKQAKEASDAAVTLITGKTYNKNQLKEAGIAPFAVLGQDFVSSLRDGVGTPLDTEKMAAILPTLPRDDAELLAKSLAAAGIR